MENIKKAGGHFLRIANILVLILIVNAIFYISIIQAYSPEAMEADNSFSPPATLASPPYIALEITPDMSEDQAQQAIAENKRKNNQAKADYEAQKQHDYDQAKLNYELQKQQKIVEKVKERSYVLNILISINTFLTILIIYFLYQAANNLIEFNKYEKNHDINI